MTTAQLLRTKYPTISDGDLTKLVEIEDKLATDSASLEAKLCRIDNADDCQACQ